MYKFHIVLVKLKRVMVCTACISVNTISDGLGWDAKGCGTSCGAQILGRMQCASTSVQKYIRAKHKCTLIHRKTITDVNLADSLSFQEPDWQCKQLHWEMFAEKVVLSQTTFHLNIFLSSKYQPPYEICVLFVNSILHFFSECYNLWSWRWQLQI